MLVDWPSIRGHRLKPPCWLASTVLTCLCAGGLCILTSFCRSVAKPAQRAAKPKSKSPYENKMEHFYITVSLLGVQPAVSLSQPKKHNQQQSKQRKRPTIDMIVCCMVDYSQTGRSGLPTQHSSSLPPHGAELLNVYSSHKNNLQQSLDVQMEFSFCIQLGSCVCMHEQQLATSPELILKVFKVGSS